MKKGAGRIELQVHLDEALHRRISDLAIQTGRPIGKIVQLGFLYGVLVPPNNTKTLSGRFIVSIIVSRRFHQALREMEIRTPAERGLLVERGLSQLNNHLFCRGEN